MCRIRSVDAQIVHHLNIYIYIYVCVCVCVGGGRRRSVRVCACVRMFVCLSRYVDMHMGMFGLQKVCICT